MINLLKSPIENYTHIIHMNKNVFKKEVRKIYDESVYCDGIKGKVLEFNRCLSDDERKLIEEWYTPSEKIGYGCSGNGYHKPHTNKWAAGKDFTDMQMLDILMRGFENEKTQGFCKICVGKPNPKPKIATSYFIKHHLKIIPILIAIISIIVAIIKK